MGYVNDKAETLILAELAQGNGWTPFAVLREMVGLIRSDFDAAMIALSLSGRVQMIPEENQKTITAGQRAAAITSHGCTWHLARLCD